MGRIINEMDHEANFRKKYANVKTQRVKADESVVPSIEEDETVEHLLAEPKTDHVSVDGMLNFGEEKEGKGLGISDISCGYDYLLDTYRGGFDTNNAQEGQDELELGVLDGLLDEVEEVEDLHCIDGLPSPGEDFLLEIGFSSQASAWDCYPPRGESHSRNVSSESQSPGLSGSSNSAVGVSESSSVTIQELDCKNDSLNKTMDSKPRCTFTYKKRRKIPVEGHIDPVSHDPQNPNELDDDDPLLSSMLVNRSAKNFGDVNKVGSRIEKRKRRPTQRYIEELSDKKSNLSKGERKFSFVSSAEVKEKRPKVKSHDELYPARPEELPEAGSENRPRRGRPKKQVIISLPEPSEEEFTSDSEDERVVRKRSDKNDRRKHQRMWTIVEVTRLVDGISEFGVGHWTEIKRLLFATSAYRTPIDLRDKWRNLLRASSLHKLKKKDADDKQSHPLRPLPKSVIRRVRELAKLHPYPRVRGKKRVDQVTAPLRKSERK